MQHFFNARLVTRNRRYSRWMMFGGLGATVVAVIITFVQPALLLVAFALMLVGGVVSQVGTAIFNRFGRSPRLDQVLDFSLKGLDDRHAIFHYYLGTNHALFTPSGVYALVPMLERGEIEFKDGAWRHQQPAKRFSLGSRVRFLRNLEKEAGSEAKRLQKFLRKRVPDQSDIIVEPLVVFIAEDTQVSAENAPLLAVHRKRLKNELRKLTGPRPFSSEDILQLATYLKLT